MDGSARPFNQIVGLTHTWKKPWPAAPSIRAGHSSTKKEKRRTRSRTTPSQLDYHSISNRFLFYFDYRVQMIWLRNHWKIVVLTLNWSLNSRANKHYLSVCFSLSETSLKTAGHLLSHVDSRCVWSVEKMGPYLSCQVCRSAIYLFIRQRQLNITVPVCLSIYFYTHTFLLKDSFIFFRSVVKADLPRWIVSLVTIATGNSVN